MFVSASPLVAEFGVTPVTIGAGLTTSKLNGADVPPPGAGLKTVIGVAPAVLRSLAGITTVNNVELMYTVGRFPPLNFAVEVGAKPVPLIMMFTPLVPTKTLDGLRLVIVGTPFVTLTVVDADAVL